VITDKAARNFAGTSMPSHLGIRMLACEPGRSTMVVTVAESHLNLHGTCHGGLLFTLADTAFGMAANAGEEKAVTQEAQIHYLAAAALGEKLTATATTLARAGRTAILDVTVTGADGRMIAVFRGQARFV
jgi:acyl-CoA thioesterase